LLAVTALSALAVLGFAFILHDVTVLPQTAGSLTFLGALFIVLLAPAMSFLWPFLARLGANPHKTTKCVIGLALAGLAYLPLVAANAHAAHGALASVWWLALAYFILEVGEVCLSPITLAAVSELAPPSVAAVMMSGWFLASSVSEQLAALFSSLASVNIPDGGVVNLSEAASHYGPVFDNMVWLGLGTAAVALLCLPLMRRWMHGSDPSA
jgi:POT family proton-dependent oligopeptide transporter